MKEAEEELVRAMIIQSASVLNWIPSMRVFSRRTLASAWSSQVMGILMVMRMVIEEM